MDKKGGAAKQTFGIGYATVIMIFVVICLSVMALLSYNAAGINESLAANNKTYITSYYSAEERATGRIAELDGIAYSSLQSLFFEESFEGGVSQLEGVELTRGPEGYTVSFSENINDRLTLSVKLLFFSEPSFHDGKRYEIQEYKTTGISEPDGGTLGIWDGKTPIGA